VNLQKIGTLCSQRDCDRDQLLVFLPAMTPPPTS
jgi:hypothetical protein